MDYNLSFLKQHLVTAVLGSISVFCIVTSVYFAFQSSFSAASIDYVAGESTQSGSLNQKMILVDVSGGVNAPGVYTIPEGSRIEDAITLAGGLSAEADLEMIAKGMNRAQRVQDGIKIYVPIQIDGSNTSHNKEAEETGSEIVSINAAASETLEGLPGIGPSTASKIIEGRPYMNLEELVSKKIVGKKVYEKIKSHISL